jgi:hypothetical protein
MESPGRRRESTVARWLLVVTRGRCVLKNRSGGRPLVLEARNEALRLVDDQMCSAEIILIFELIPILTL